MARYLRERILSACLTMFFITVIIFVLLSLMETVAAETLSVSGAADTAITEYGPPDAHRAFEKNRSVLLRYALWLRDVFQGDWGVSYRYGVPVREIILQRFGPSAFLMCSGLLLAALFSIPVGVMGAYWPGSAWDRFASGPAIFGYAVPRFVACVLFIYLFSFRLHLLPMTGMHASGVRSFGDLLRHLILPASMIALGVSGYLVQQIRDACRDVFREDYVKTARAKGLSELEVVLRHGLRTAFPPILSQLALEIPEIVGESAITEKIFGWPGIGALMIEAIKNRDAPLIMGIALVIAMIALAANIALDVAYGLLDPRVSRVWERRPL